MQLALPALAAGRAIRKMQRGVATHQTWTVGDPGLAGHHLPNSPQPGPQITEGAAAPIGSGLEESIAGRAPIHLLGGLGGAGAVDGQLSARGDCSVPVHAAIEIFPELGHRLEHQPGVLAGPDDVELGAAPAAVFEDLNELGATTAFPEAPPLAVLGLQRPAQRLLPDGNCFFGLLSHCGPNARLWPKVWPNWSQQAMTRLGNMWPRFRRSQL